MGQVKRFLLNEVKKTLIRKSTKGWSKKNSLLISLCSQSVSRKNEPCPKCKGPITALLAKYGVCIFNF